MEKMTLLSQNGRMVIPARFRKELGLEAGDEVILRIEGRSIRLIPLGDAINQAQSLVKSHIVPGVSLVDALLEDRKNEASNE